jgi:hypothetical protein
MAIIPHPLYSPDLAPCDFFLFPYMNFKLKGHRFDTIEEIQTESQSVLDTVADNLRKRSKNAGDGGTGV